MIKLTLQLGRAKVTIAVEAAVVLALVLLLV